MCKSEWLQQDYREIVKDVSADSSETFEAKNEPTEQEKTNAKFWREESLGKRQRLLNRLLQRPKILSLQVVISEVAEYDICKRTCPIVDVVVQTDRSQKTVITRRVKRFRVVYININKRLGMRKLNLRFFLSHINCLYLGRVCTSWFKMLALH